MKNWKSQPLNFEVFKQQKPECGCVTEILVTNPTIFGNYEEHELNMCFCDGYAIEMEVGTCPPLIMIYPTMSQVNADSELKNRIIQYTQSASENDITPYDSALAFGIIYRAEDLGINWAVKCLKDLKTGSLVVEGHAIFKLVERRPNMIRCKLIHGSTKANGYIPNPDGLYDFLNCDLEWGVFSINPEVNGLLQKSMTADEELKHHLLQQIERSGLISAERDKDMAVISDTVSIWVESELQFVEITDVFARNGNIFIKGFDDQGHTFNALQIVGEYNHIEDFLSLYVPDYIPFSPSVRVIKEDILQGYQKYQEKLTKQVARLLETKGDGNNITCSGKTLLVDDGKVYIEYPDKKRTSEVSAIIQLIERL